MFCAIWAVIHERNNNKKIYNGSTTEDSSLACGGWSCALSVHRQLQISPIHHTDISSAVCQWKQTRWNEIHRHGKFWLRALESESVFTKALWEHLCLLHGYFSGFLFPIIIFFRWTALLLSLFFFQVYFLELSIYTKISLTVFFFPFSPASYRLALHATELVVKVCLTEGPRCVCRADWEVDCRPSGAVRSHAWKMLFGLCGIWLVFIKVVFGCSHASEEGDDARFSNRRTGREREWRNNTKRGRLRYTELGLGSVRRSGQRVCLWATVALHLWGVQVTGAAEWTGEMFEQVHVDFEGGRRWRRRKQRDHLPPF